MADFPSPSSTYGRWNLMDVRDAEMGDNWPVPPPLVTPTVEYLVVAGGGGGGQWAGGGGGGAGGCRTATGFAVSSGSAITVTVGGGGTGGGNQSTLPTAGSNSVFSSITSTGGGKVLQVVQATYSTATSSSSTTLADTGLTLNITPSSASSNVLLWMFMPTAKTTGNSNNSVILQLQRNGTNVLQAYEMHKNFVDQNYYGSTTLTYLDSPATTSSTTYKVQFRNRVAAADVIICKDDQTAVLIAAEIGA